MRLLLDTHAFLWIVAADRRLSSSARTNFEDPENDIFLSLASVWEMAVKVSIGKLDLGMPIDRFLAEQLAENRIELLPITLQQVLHTASLPLHHRDPFDRLLIAQSMSEGIPLVSADPFFDSYGVQRIW